ncbi:MAG: aminoglycoside phosphotransferase family protein [Actinobacteria bacterium]|nr:aminoglycoside phosphotransferase family protein [Actinomycetota bacterium]
MSATFELRAWWVVWFGRRRPSVQTLRWVERSLGGTARVVAWRRMTGGISSAVHRLTIDYGSYRDVLVLRQYEHAADGSAKLVRDEAAILRAVHAAGVPAPEPIAADAEGRESDGRPAMLMTRLPGRLDLTPADPEGWLQQIAAMAVRIHDLRIAAGPFRSRIDAVARVIPASATRPVVWKTAFRHLRQQAPELATCFIHRDFQHFNLLWRRGQLTGVVDWAASCSGPAEFDAGHCRLNLAVLFGADWAERFRMAYQAEAGRTIDPWWDLYAVTSYSDEWRRFIPVQVAGRTPVDVVAMTAEVERLLDSIVRRF